MANRECRFGNLLCSRGKTEKEEEEENDEENEEEEEEGHASRLRSSPPFCFLPPDSHQILQQWAWKVGNAHNGELELLKSFSKNGPVCRNIGRR